MLFGAVREVVVIEDFLDGSRIPQNLAESIRMKAGKVLVVLVGHADMGYARYIAQALKGEVYTYRNGRFVKL